ncbi:MAG TPA: GNAT family N-acetyltransferase [Gammaproteobacteria bacterium]
MADLRVRVADYADDHETLRAIRFAVFVDEQHVPPHIEMDERDERCVHVLAYLDAGPVGTGRIDLEAGGKVGRVAVLAPFRRKGVGQAIMERLQEIAAAAGCERVWCHAQVTAVPFYERLGYRVVGGRFQEAGIEHARMERTL